MQSVGQRVHVFAQPDEVLSNGPHACRGIVRSLDATDVNGDARKTLSEIVVQLARQAPVLVLLSRHQHPGELLYFAMARFERGLVVLDQRLGDLALGNVDIAADEALIFSSRREPGDADREQPSVHAISPAHPVLACKWTTKLKCRGIDRLKGLEVVGMYGFVPAFIQHLRS